MVYGCIGSNILEYQPRARKVINIIKPGNPRECGWVFSILLCFIAQIQELENDSLKQLQQEDFVSLSLSRLYLPKVVSYSDPRGGMDKSALNI